LPLKYQIEKKQIFNQNTDSVLSNESLQFKIKDIVKGHSVANVDAEREGNQVRMTVDDVQLEQ